MKKNILVIIDMQNDFTTGVLGNQECKTVIPEIVKIINETHFDSIILTKDTHHQDYLNTQEGKRLPIPHCIENTDGWNICPEIMSAVQHNYQPSNYHVIEKHTFGSLYMANMLKEKYLLKQENFTFTVVGVCTGICVISNVMLLKAALPESRIQVIAKACACVTPESHKTALDAMEMCQVNIIR